MDNDRSGRPAWTRAQELRAWEAFKVRQRLEREERARTLALAARRAHEVWTAAKLEESAPPVRGFAPRPDETVHAVAAGVDLVEIGRSGARVRDESTIRDSGTFLVTSERCVFIGTRGKVEWPFSRLVGFSLDGAAMATFDIRNRQRTTGVAYAEEQAPRLEATIRAAIAKARGDDVHGELVAHLEAKYRRAWEAWHANEQLIGRPEPASTRRARQRPPSVVERLGRQRRQ